MRFSAQTISVEIFDKSIGGAECLARLNKVAIQHKKERQQQIVNAQTLKLQNLQKVEPIRVHLQELKPVAADQPQQEIAVQEVQMVQDQIKEQPIATN